MKQNQSNNCMQIAEDWSNTLDQSDYIPDYIAI